MTTAQDISRVVKNPPTCTECKDHKLTVTSQTLSVSDQGMGSLINAGCGSCGTMYEVSLTGQVIGEQR